MDDCSFKLEHFDFDYHGITVSPIHAAPDTYLWVQDASDTSDILNDDEDGRSASELILRNFVDETVYGTLPAGTTWDDFNVVSLYCVLRDVNFAYYALRDLDTEPGASSILII